MMKLFCSIFDRLFPKWNHPVLVVDPEPSELTIAAPEIEVEDEPYRYGSWRTSEAFQELQAILDQMESDHKTDEENLT